MSKAKSSTHSAFNGTHKVEPASDKSKQVAERRRFNMQIIQNILLIWLDGNFDENNTDYRNKMAQLRRVVNTINTYTDSEQCIQFLETTKNEKVCMIISGYLGQYIVPHIHDMSPVDSIFIFCGNKKRHEEWAKKWSKIKGVFTEISPICEALKQSIQQCEQNVIPMSFVATSEDLSKKKLDQLDPSFMYTQILKEILLTIEFEPKHFKEFIEYCRNIFDSNIDELQNVNKLQKEYRDETPIWWYTYECFLYPMLNRSLRLMNVDIMIRMGFFISDLHRHIDRLHQEQYGTQNSPKSFIVYRGQGMSTIEFDRMNKTKGGLISFNSFLSTSKNQEISLAFANSAVTNPDLVGVLFVMTIDPSQSTTPFASIVDVSYYKNVEDEVLFAMHTIFRIINIKPMDKNERLYQVDLILTNDNDKDLRQLTDRIRKETEGSTGWDQLGELLLKIGQSEKAEQVYNILLEQVSDEIEKARIYNRIGWAKNDQGEYKQALAVYEKSLEIRQQLLPPNHPDLAASYNNMGLMYSIMNEYSKALSYYEKTLDIDQATLPPNHPDLAKSYNNIGVVYSDMSEYSKALFYYEKTNEIFEKSLPSNHPDLAASYNNIGSVHENMGEYSKAISYYEKTLAIQQQSLPPNHPSLSSSYNNIGSSHENMGEYLKAREFYERAVGIGEQSLVSDHPKLQKWRTNLDRIKKRL